MGNTTVCIVEDDEATREAIRGLLLDEGYKVIEASNGAEGQRMMEASSERLIVVLDYRLPVLDGCDLLDIVAHNDDLRARHSFVMMSASPRQTVEDCEEALDELVVPLLPKPFHIDELVEAVQHAEERLRLDPA